MITFRGSNQHDLPERFFDELTRYGAGFERVARVERLLVPEEQRDRSQEPAVWRDTGRFHAFVIAGYLREHGAVPDPAATFEVVRRLPEMVELEVYLGLFPSMDVALAAAESMCASLTERLQSLGVTVADGQYTGVLRDSPSSSELGLRYHERLTRSFRLDRRPLWSRLRDDVRERGIDPTSIVIAHFGGRGDWDDRDNTVVLVTLDGKVFRIHWPASTDKAFPDENVDPNPTREWDDISHAYRTPRWLGDYVDYAFLLAAEWAGTLDTLETPGREQVVPLGGDGFVSPVDQPIVYARQNLRYQPPRYQTVVAPDAFLSILADADAPRPSTLSISRKVIIDWAVGQDGERWLLDRWWRFVSLEVVTDRNVVLSLIDPSADDPGRPRYPAHRIYLPCGLAAPYGDGEDRAEALTAAIEGAVRSRGVAVTRCAIDRGRTSLLFLNRPNRKDIELNTRLRQSEEPIWVRLRQELRDHGVEPSESVLAWVTWEGGYYFYIVATRDRRVFHFDYWPLDALGNLADTSEQAVRWRSSPWVDLTHCWEGTAYRRDIQSAFTLLDRESPDEAR